MFNKIKNLLKYLKEKNSRIIKYENENDILKARLKIYQNDMMQAFMDGNQNTWTLIQVVIYDMYKNMELLDYGTFINAISKNLTKYDQDKILREEKIKQFNTDLKFREHMLGSGDASNN